MLLDTKTYYADEITHYCPTCNRHLAISLNTSLRASNEGEIILCPICSEEIKENN